MTLHKLGHMRQRVKGERGLLLAVICQAVKDTHSRRDELRQDAHAYFESDTYKRHLSMLDVPQNWTPQL